MATCSSDKTDREMAVTQLAQLVAQSTTSPVIELEKENPVWQRIMESLHTKELLFLWKAAVENAFQVHGKCSLCVNGDLSLFHVLSHCSVAVRVQYTWRHDCALKIIVDDLMNYLNPEDKLYYADLPGLRASDCSPATVHVGDILISYARPDIVVIKQKLVFLLELTIPFNSAEYISNAKVRKMSKVNYQRAQSELKAKGLEPSLLTIEIGALGHWPLSSRNALQRVFPSISEFNATRLLDEAANKVISDSYQLFEAIFISGPPNKLSD